MHLITGANGMTGRAVLAALKSRGARVRVLATSAASAGSLLEAGADEAALGRFDDAASLERAMAGVETVFHVPPRMKPDEVANGFAVIAAARSAGVARIALHSVVNPQVDAIAFHAAKRRVEEAAVLSGLRWIVVQPTNYMQNVAWNWARLTEHGGLLFPYAAAAKVSWLDLEDYAPAVARLLTEPGFDHGTYEAVSTADPLDRHELAAIWSKVLGRPVVAETMPLDDYMALPHWRGRDPREMAILRTMFETFDRHGSPGGASKVLSWLLGREPTGYAAFAERFARARQPSSPRNGPTAAS